MFEDTRTRLSQLQARMERAAQAATPSEE
jgi:hypothetical protein